MFIKVHVFICISANDHFIATVGSALGHELKEAMTNFCLELLDFIDMTDEQAIGICLLSLARVLSGKAEAASGTFSAAADVLKDFGWGWRAEKIR